jgi:hypothetical protein
MREPSESPEKRYQCAATVRIYYTKISNQCIFKITGA